MGSYLQVQHIRPGFDMSRHLLFATLLPATEHPKANFYEDMLGRLGALPGVRRVTSVGSLPLSGSGGGAQQVSIPGITDEPVGIGAYWVGPEYFTAMGTAILRGREFTALDSAGVVIVNEQMARGFWGDAGRAIGQFIRVDGKDRQVVGVVETGKYQTLVEEPMPDLFPAHAQRGNRVNRDGRRSGGDGGFSPQSVPGVGSRRDPEFPGHDAPADGCGVIPLAGCGGPVGDFAILGIFLAGVGLYGVVSYGVTCRSHEIGVRMAMGARPADVLRVVLRQGLSMVAIGAAIGTAVAVAAARVVSAVLYRVSPADPLALAEAALAVATVTFLAIQLPARRAIRTDPMTVLRNE